MDFIREDHRREASIEDTTASELAQSSSRDSAALRPPGSKSRKKEFRLEEEIFARQALVGDGNQTQGYVNGESTQTYSPRNKEQEGRRKIQKTKTSSLGPL
ncbi:hypothetical protein DUI87_25675 [Hirundo rustica rustica]|uniref:Uncharacterized protein n=1 Tax=Hirundo rustica rustica TaxID=333673 RepID=A0A3M0JAB9_HIRRU|nr:hypothetical protein DUI87_25675 [Hirundo rustica rustica]